jgi:hypothetical protein
VIGQRLLEPHQDLVGDELVLGRDAQTARLQTQEARLEQPLARRAEGVQQIEAEPLGEAA